jgi:hypothetical protein
VCRKHTLSVKLHSACGNRTHRVEINLVIVEITLVLVGITFVLVEITLVSVILTRIRVKITLVVSCVYKAHFACINLTLRVETNLVRVEITIVRVVIADLFFCYYEKTLFIRKLHALTPLLK